MTSPSIQLEPFTDHDVDFLLDWKPSQEEFLRWDAHAFTFPLNTSQLDPYFSDCVGKSNTTYTRNPYKVLLQNECIGYVELNMIDKVNKSAIIDHVLIKDEFHRGKGIGQHMIRHILTIGFNELSLHRICLSVPNDHLHAIHCYEKSGFVREGLVRDVLRVNNHYWSYVLMGILKHEWENIQTQRSR